MNTSASVPNTDPSSYTRLTRLVWTIRNSWSPLKQTIRRTFLIWCRSCAKPRRVPTLFEIHRCLHAGSELSLNVWKVSAEKFLTEVALRINGASQSNNLRSTESHETTAAGIRVVSCSFVDRLFTPCEPATEKRW